MDFKLPGSLSESSLSSSNGLDLPKAGPTAGDSPLARPQIPDHELIRLIGQGSYGEVWLARSALGSYRAVKVVYRKSFDNDKPYEREFEGLKKFEPISHARESQVDIFHVGRNDAAGFFYYIMELADGVGGSGVSDLGSGEKQHPRPQTLDASTYTPRTLKHDLRTRGALPVAECVQIALSLTRVLDHLHAHGLVHRDIKPSNIIFVNGVPKLVDIGLVTSVDATRSFVGTDGYIPPEGPGTPQADLYSLGKVLYECVTGKDRLDFPELPADCRARPDFEQLLEFNEILTKACDNDPRQRYANADAMRADLEVLRAGRSVKRRRRAEQRSAWTRKSIALVSLVGLVLGCLVLATNELARRTATNKSAVVNFENSGTKDREAYNFFRLGQTCQNIGRPDGLVQAIAYFDQALQRDPKFARAYALKADAYSWLDRYEYMAPKECRSKAREAALAALALDDTLVSAHLALASCKLYFEWDWAGAEKAYRRAIELNPDNQQSRIDYAWLLASTGRFEESFRQMRIVLEKNPGSVDLNLSLGVHLFFAKQYDEALGQLRKTITLGPNYPATHLRIGEVLWTMGKHEEALTEWEKFGTLWSGSHGGWKEAHEAYRHGGVEAFWRRELEDCQKHVAALKEGEWFPPMGLVWAYAGLGDLDKAFEWVDKACEDRQPLLLEITVNPHYAALWPDPRFETLLKRMGLEKYFPKGER